MISFVKGTRLVSYVLRNQFVSMLLYKLNFDMIHGDASDKIHISSLSRLGKNLFHWLGVRFTLGGILCTVFNDLVARYTILHVHIGTPCRQLHRVEAVDKTIVSRG